LHFWLLINPNNWHLSCSTCTLIQLKSKQQPKKCRKKIDKCIDMLGWCAYGFHDVLQFSSKWQWSNIPRERLSPKSCQDTQPLNP
jgi:hypothetical protein